MSLVRSGLVVRSQIVPLVLSALPPGLASELAKRHGIDPRRMNERPLEVPLSVEQALPDEAAQLVGDDFLGVRVAMELPRGALGLPEFIAASAKTVGEMIELVLRYLPLLDDGAQFDLERSGELASITHRFPGVPLACGRQGNELLVCAFVRFIGVVTGEPWSPLRVTFAHPPPSRTGPLAEALPGAALTFGAGFNSLTLPVRDLSRPLRTSDEALSTVLAQLADEKLSEAPRKQGWLFRVRTRLTGMLDQRPRLETLARALHMSQRTLQRRLADEGIAFDALLDDVRRERAHVLLERALPLAEVSAELGFADVSAFSRAFKRWTGSSPGAYREQLRRS